MALSVSLPLSRLATGGQASPDRQVRASPQLTQTALLKHSPMPTQLCGGHDPRRPWATRHMNSRTSGLTSIWTVCPGLAELVIQVNLIGCIPALSVRLELRWLASTRRMVVRLCGRSAWPHFFLFWVVSYFVGSLPKRRTTGEGGTCLEGTPPKRHGKWRTTERLQLLIGSSEKSASCSGCLVDGQADGAGGRPNMAGFAITM